MISPEDSYLLSEKIVEHHLKDIEKKELLSKEYLEEYKKLGYGIYAVDPWEKIHENNNQNH